MASPYRITNTKNTIPLSTALNGTVTTDSLRTDVLNYSGTSDLATIYSEANTGVGGFSYIFIPASDMLIQVLFVVDTGTDTYNIFLAEAASGISGGAASYVHAKLVSYSYLNDGGADGEVNNVKVENGDGFTSPPSGLSISGDTLWKKPVYVDATGTDFLVYQSPE